MRPAFLSWLCVLFFIPASAQEILVKPYLQPGNASTFAKEHKVIIWQTDSIPGNFKVTYRLKGSPKIYDAKISSVQLKLKGKTTHLYRASLQNLKFDTLYTYDVALNAKSIATVSFKTRSKKATTRFAVLGDFGAGTRPQLAIAYQMAVQKPQFVVTTGDNAYQDGLESDYRKNVFPAYTAAPNDPATGADLMTHIPFYMVLGNHDVHGDNLDNYPGGLAYFYYNDLPLNAPLTDRTCTATGQPGTVKTFKKNTKPRFPKMSNFSFDYGNVHITCLDANDYINPLDAQLIAWLRRDIELSKADWKILTFHHAGFNSSKAHYDEQIMRLLSPLFEQLKVDLVLTGHVHNYQRSKPLLFEPKKNEAGDQFVVSAEGRVDGKFTIDETFDGENDTTPAGIIHIVTGAGGGALYDLNMSQKPELWKHEPKENWVPFTEKFISHLYSFTFIETNGKRLELKQIVDQGNIIDRIVVTK